MMSQCYDYFTFTTPLSKIAESIRSFFQRVTFFDNRFYFASFK